MTVYAATETEMGATTAKFSRLNGYYVVAESLQPYLVEDFPEALAAFVIKKAGG